MKVCSHKGKGTRPDGAGESDLPVKKLGLFLHAKAAQKAFWGDRKHTEGKACLGGAGVMAAEKKARRGTRIAMAQMWGESAWKGLGTAFGAYVPY